MMQYITAGLTNDRISGIIIVGVDYGHLNIYYNKGEGILSADVNTENKTQILYHTLDQEEVYKLLDTNPNGLTSEEAANRLLKYGRNELEEGKKKTIFQKFLDQFKDLMIIVLLIAAIIAGITGEIADTLIIIAIVVLNAIMGVVQENKAEKSLEALKKMSSTYAKVRRDGDVIEIKSEELVPGDIVLIEAGDFVPADLRLTHAINLQIEEAALTGESVPVDKSVETLHDPELVLGDRKNLAYSSSPVTYGRGEGIVVATGMNTEVGKIASRISSTEEQETPLQRKLGEMTKILTIGILIIAAITFVVGIYEGREILNMFLTAIALGVAAIPEGLPAIVTIVLAIGVQKMAKRNSIVRKLSAVETLGSTEIICSDKTGTLTQNKMTVLQVYVNNQIIKTEDFVDYQKDPTCDVFLQALALCNDVRIPGGAEVTAQTNGNNGEEPLKLIGDPTETALAFFSLIKGLNKHKLEMSMPRVGELPFDSKRKLMSTINSNEGKPRVFTKGAPDILLERCTHILINNEVLEMDDNYRKAILEANHTMASQALRVLGIAIKDIDTVPEHPTTEELENNLIFVGLTGMIDPPRPEVKDAVAKCAEAGIRPIMITGDHRDTAAAIAKEIGIAKDDSEVITGAELSNIPDDEFFENVTKYSVYARVSPEHKVRIVEAWKKHGRIVAMTGDGVNDAPALKASDIGIGMGITGTDVAKGVSNMVLADDNFATIVVAVEEGRKIYSNIRKTIQYLLSSNLAEILTIFIGTLLNWEVLKPIHILWVNLVTDSLPALAISFEQAESDVMKEPPRDPKANFFAEGLGVRLIYQGICIGFLTLLAYYIGGHAYNHEVAMTMAFATLSFIQLFHAFNVRSADKSLLTIGIFSNKYVVGAFIIAGLMQYLVIAIPALNGLFHTAHLDATEWGIVFLLSFAIIPIVEIVKLIGRIVRRSKAKNQ